MFGTVPFSVVDILSNMFPFKAHLHSVDFELACRCRLISCTVHMYLRGLVVGVWIITCNLHTHTHLAYKHCSS